MGVLGGGTARVGGGDTQQYENVWLGLRKHRGGPESRPGAELSPALSFLCCFPSWSRQLLFSQDISLPSLLSSLLRMESQNSQTSFFFNFFL